MVDIAEAKIALRESLRNAEILIDQKRAEVAEAEEEAQRQNAQLRLEWKRLNAQQEALHRDREALNRERDEIRRASYASRANTAGDSQLDPLLTSLGCGPSSASEPTSTNWLWEACGCARSTGSTLSRRAEEVRRSGFAPASLTPPRNSWNQADRWGSEYGPSPYHSGHIDAVQSQRMPASPYKDITAPSPDLNRRSASGYGIYGKPCSASDYGQGWNQRR
eukprot:TRINITY_DN110284_c0_g1_i1.p1 TRINITY_DN110284_c0_g1~~TRINITY_DN110284_c0_g1_i1.p1  ORF type:complete len:221 (+),score=45.18 TRINITY_DN110284_c0_g1_i1:38-700(+)